MIVRGIAVLAAMAVVCASPAFADRLTPRPPTQRDLLHGWVMARCLARGFGLKSAAGQDATNSAAAILDRGVYGADAYEALDAGVNTVIRSLRPSVPGN